MTQTSTQGLYTGEGLSLKLGTKGETVTKAKLVWDQGQKHRASDDGET